MSPGQIHGSVKSLRAQNCSRTRIARCWTAGLVDKSLVSDGYCMENSICEVGMLKGNTAGIAAVYLLARLTDRKVNKGLSHE